MYIIEYRYNSIKIKHTSLRHELVYYSCIVFVRIFYWAYNINNNISPKICVTNITHVFQ